jgi:alcohol dehydrogenase class IV
LIDILETAGVQVRLLPVAGEPTLDTIREAVRVGREYETQVVAGFGGGSALDSAKAAAALIPNEGDPLDYLEVIGKGRQLAIPALPVIAIPTTAGTGSEATRNAVISAPEQRVKVSLRHISMLPRLALVDPELTYSLPPAVTASTGMDALTQLIEPFTSARANPLTDALCREAIPLAGRSLRKAYEDGSDRDARREMARASLSGGLALANAGLGAVHGFAGVIGGMFDAPHGAICARLLPLVMEATLTALKQREPANPVVGRYDQIARLLTGNPSAKANDGLAWVWQLMSDLGIPRLSRYGIRSEDIETIAEKSSAASSMKANPVVLKRDELEKILMLAL